MHGRRLLALATVALAFASVPAAEARPKPKIPFRLTVPSAGSTTAIRFRVNLTRRVGAAAAKLDLRTTVKNRGDLPGNVLLGAEVLRDKRKPLRATVVIAMFHPKFEARERAHAAQLEVTISGNFALRGFNIDEASHGAWSTDWFEEGVDFPDPCGIPDGGPDDVALFAGPGGFPDPPGARRLMGEFGDATCVRADSNDFTDFMRFGVFPGAVTAPHVSITPFPGNPFEATLVLSDDIVFTAIKVQATGENSFSQCYRDGAPCEVHDAGEPGNFVIFEFPGGTSETAGFNVRSSNTEVGDWGTVNFFVRPAGETAFQGPFPKTP